ncbi:MAG TPA: phosphatase PAP2 family protein [Paludibacter sp.]|nr:phosphatase PAP2 family protein [Paludibacter sp.]
MKAKSIRFLPVEKLTFLYMSITSLVILLLLPGPQVVFALLGKRFLFLLVIFGLSYLSSIKSNWTIKFLRYAFIGGLLIYWYPETYDINRLISNRDYWLAGIEQHIFGFQPALLFNKLYPQHWIAEIMNLGYLSYYPLIICTSIYFYFKDRKYFKYFFFVVLFSFFCYYLIFNLFPAAGPQYYYQAIGLENASSGIFPRIGLYFSNHKELQSMDDSGFFSRLVQNTQMVGERPTAAFPSSHVGISTLILILLLKNRRYLYLACITPLYVALVGATVYIQAHYVIDVVAGFVTAFLFYYAGSLACGQFTYRIIRIPWLRKAVVEEPLELGKPAE